MGILIFKGLTARRLYKSFGVKGLTQAPIPLITKFIYGVGFANGDFALLPAK
jgi:hypothetical protein